MKTQYPTDRIILARTTHAPGEWNVITNPSPGNSERGMSIILLNDVNEYAEYENCGVTYRMIRRRQLADYGIPTDSVGLGRDELHG